MKSASSPFWRYGIRAVYLLPVLTWVTTLIAVCVPHLFFIYDGIAHETVSTVQLMGNAWQESLSLLQGTANGTPAAVLFSYAATAVVILSWIAIFWHALTAIPAAICSCYAFSNPPTARITNRIKRIFQIFCPNRICYVLFNLLPLLPAFFPQILVSLYASMLGMTVSVHAFGIMDWIPTVLLTALNVVSFLGTLSLQSRLHLDLFRLYKARNGGEDSSNASASRKGEKHQ